MAPTLLITAHYDCFSPAPAAPACADSAGTGAATALLLLRLLNRMFATAESRPARNVLVVLTAGGPYGQEGLRQWLADADPQQVEAIEAAIVFDSIGGSSVLQQQAAAALGSSSDDADGSLRQRQQLHAHFASSGSTEQWLKALQVAAERAGTSIAPVAKDLPAEAASKAAEGASAADASAAGGASFGHEHLARRGLAAVTLTSMAAAPAAVLSGRVRASSVGDVAAGVNLDGVLSAAQVAADAVSRWLYPDVDAELRLLDLLADAAAHKDFLRGWVGLLAEMHAVMPFTQVGPSLFGMPCQEAELSLSGRCRGLRPNVPQGLAVRVYAQTMPLCCWCSCWCSRWCKVWLCNWAVSRPAYVNNTMPACAKASFRASTSMYGARIQGHFGSWAMPVLLCALPLLCCAVQADGAGALLHDSLRAFLKANSHSLKRHVWKTAGSPAALEAWTGTLASMQVSNGKANTAAPLLWSHPALWCATGQVNFGVPCGVTVQIQIHLCL